MKTQYNNVIADDKYILAEGDLPILLVAHLDTVFNEPPVEIYHDYIKKVLWSPQGLGADDKAGVYSILQIIEDGYRPSVLFTTDEEIGAIGCLTVVNQNPKCPLKDLRAIIQLDRCGKKDSVFYDCENWDFEKWVNSFGFKTAYGSFSDISILAPSWGIAAANLSIGYVDEHSQVERLFLNDMNKTIEKVEKMLDAADEIPFFEYISKSSRKVRCLFCGKKMKNNQEFSQENPKNICNRCYDFLFKEF